MLVNAGNPKLTALWELDPAQALRLVTRAIFTCEGNMRKTARALHISLATLKRWRRKYPSLGESVASARLGAKAIRPYKQGALDDDEEEEDDDDY